MGSLYNFLREFTEKWPVKGYFSSLKMGILLQITGKGKGICFVKTGPERESDGNRYDGNGKGPGMENLSFFPCSSQDLTF